MGALYVVLVLAVGYVYCSIDPASKYKLARRDGYSLYFHIGFWGVIWTIIAVFIFFILDLTNIPSLILEKIGIHFNIFQPVSTFTMPEIKQLLLCIGALSVTACIAFCKKLFYVFWPTQKNKFILKTVKKNALELILFESVSNSLPLAFTMDSDKVYVGFVSEFDLLEGKIEFITILPLLSGYRDDKKMLKFMTNYYEHYIQNIGEKAEKPDSPEMVRLLNKFKIVVPFSEVVSVNGFDINAYKEFIASDFNPNSYRESGKQVEVTHSTFHEAS
ncbi:hypothetical protein [Rheinheimera sp. MMS21-TC3]|uniref:hypothetical protein n=1 Tax=Rheinheimera sp. MMS21-TC3 TaxID=3072790 RepID=UPI0028C3BF99|nr:hypothetical protein [Rheinheimera sp. MMS21-TC3]WNO60874.1 hypothetical protein RDV63_07895 [Rheinheimera sp. MMS21-TC3]